MDFGWKTKAERLRMVILSCAHQLAKDLPPGISKTLEIFGRVAKIGGEEGVLREEMLAVMRDHADEPRPLWEPIEVHGWKIEATMYLQSNQLWWLVHAVRPTSREPSDKDVAFLDKVLEHLGGDPKRDMIIGPRTSPADDPGRLAFGWWTWFNTSPLFEIQVNESKKRDKEKIRVVPLGAPESEGYVRRSLERP
jgi:hypothetical protein